MVRFSVELDCVKFHAQCSIVRYFLDLPYNTLASPVSKEYKNVLQRTLVTLVAVWEIDPLTCCSSNAAHMRAVLSYERWQFSDFQGARTSWGTQNDLWKSRLLLPASQDINRYPIYPQVLGWMIRTPWNSYFVTKCHKCFCGQSARDSGSFNVGLRFWNGAFLNPPGAPSAFNWGIESMQSGGVRTASLGWRYHLQHHQQSSGHVYAGCWWSLSLLKQDFSFQVLLPWFSPLFFLGTG